jgi:hypothetical protein
MRKDITCRALRDFYLGKVVEIAKSSLALDKRLGGLSLVPDFIFVLGIKGLVKPLDDLLIAGSELQSWHIRAIFPVIPLAQRLSPPARAHGPRPLPDLLPC